MVDRKITTKKGIPTIIVPKHKPIRKILDMLPSIKNEKERNLADFPNSPVDFQLLGHLHPPSLEIPQKDTQSTCQTAKHTDGTFP